MPANNNFSSATALTSAKTGSLASQSTAGATTETGEPGHYNYNKGPAYPVARTLVGPYNTVWYSWLCPATNYYYFSTRDLTGAMLTNFPSTIQAFTGSAVNALTAVTLVMDQSVGDGNGADNGASIAFLATSGTVYYFQVDTRIVNQTGNFQIIWGEFTFPRFGDCSGNEADFNVTEQCMGNLVITDVTKDAVYYFGTYAAAPGNWQVRYVGGAFKEFTYQSTMGFGADYPLVITGTAYTAYPGVAFVGSAVVWDGFTSYSAGQVAMISDHMFGNSGVGDYTNTIFKATTTTVPLYPGSAGGGWTDMGAYTSSMVTSPNTSFDPAQTYVAPGGGANYYCVDKGNPGVNGTEVYAASAPAGGELYDATSSPAGAYQPDVTAYSDWVTCGYGLFAPDSYATAPAAAAAHFCARTALFQNPGGGDIGMAFATKRTYAYVSGTTISKVTLWGNNGSANPSLQLLYFPFTISMLAGAGFTLTGSGTSWTINFGIQNQTSTDWNNCTVALLNTGGVSSASSAQTGFDIAPSTTSTTGNFSFSATPGLVTATIQISRNGVVVGTIAYPLYPVIAISFASLNGFERNCTPKCWHSALQYSMAAGTWPSAWGPSTATFQFSIASGPATFADDTVNPCVAVAGITATPTLAAGPTTIIQPDFFVTGTVQSVPVQCTITWGTNSLPTFTQTISIPAT